MEDARVFHAHQNAPRSGDSPAEIEDFCGCFCKEWSTARRQARV